MMNKETILKNTSSSKIYKSFQDAIRDVTSDMESIHFKITAKLKKKVADEHTKRKRQLAASLSHFNKG